MSCPRCGYRDPRKGLCDNCAKLAIEEQVAKAIGWRSRMYRGPAGGKSIYWTSPTKPGMRICYSDCFPMFTRRIDDIVDEIRARKLPFHVVEPNPETGEGACACVGRQGGWSNGDTAALALCAALIKYCKRAKR